MYTSLTYFIGKNFIVLYYVMFTCPWPYKYRPPWKVPGHPPGQRWENVSHLLPVVVWSFKWNQRLAKGLKKDVYVCLCVCKCTTVYDVHVKLKNIIYHCFWSCPGHFHLHLCFPLCPSLADLLLGTADEYRFLSGGSIPVPGQSDSENFTQTMDSMAIMGFTPEELLCKTG